MQHNHVNRLALKSCGTRTIKPGEKNLYIEFLKHNFDQIMQEKHENFSRQMYSFLESKTLGVSEETDRRATMIPVRRIYLLYLQTVLIIAWRSVTIYTMQVSNIFTGNVIFCPSKADNNCRFKNISCNRNEPNTLTHGKL